MKRCWIHIGMHKTGSTSVQRHLANVKNPVGWRFLTIGGRSNMSSAIYAMFHTPDAKLNGFARRGDTDEVVAEKGGKWRDELLAAIQEPDVETFIISGEALPMFGKEGIANFHQFLAPHFDEIRVIGYVRPPVAFKNSRYQEILKHFARDFAYVNMKMKYRNRFLKFDEIFGRDKVILRKFDPSSFPAHCSVQDFCQQIGIPFPSDPPVERVNESLSREACGVLYAFRKFGPGYGTGKQAVAQNAMMVRPLLLIKGTKFNVSRHLLEETLEEEEKDFVWMEKRLGTSIWESEKSSPADVMSEDDLLTIRRSSCLAYADKFQQMHGRSLPTGNLDPEDIVAPAEVAEFMTSYFNLCGEIMAEKRAAKVKKPRKKKTLVSRLKKFPRKTFRFLKRLIS